MSLKYAVLATLARRPRSGYEIARGIDGGIGYFWKVTHQQIYKALADLEAEGWVRFKEVTQKNAPAKKVYRLAPRGLQELRGWMQSETEEAFVRDPFLIKIFVGYLLAPEKLLGVLASQRAKRKRILTTYLDIEQRYFADPAKLSRPDAFQRLVIRRGICHARNWLEWAEEAEKFIKSSLGADE